MPQSVADLEQRRAKLIAEMSRLDDLRPGCITGIVRRCGNPPPTAGAPELYPDRSHGNS